LGFNYNTSERRDCRDLAGEVKMKEYAKRLYRKVSSKQLEGIGVIEVILILVIIIGLVLIFRNQIAEIINDAFNSINSDAKGIGSDIVVH
jgi:hypothetical protein